MKKIIVALIAVALMASPVMAVKPQPDLSSTLLYELKVNIEYDNAGTPTGAVIIASAIVLNANGERAGTYTDSATWAQLPAGQKTNLQNFLNFVGRRINNAAVSEDVNPTQIP